jgi:hypothetical protein
MSTTLATSVSQTTFIVSATANATIADGPNCSLRHLDGHVRITVIALSVVVALLAILLLVTCAFNHVPEKKKKAKATKMKVMPVKRAK